MNEEQKCNMKECDIQSIKSKVDDIHDYIKGEGYHEENGVIPTLKNHGMRIKILERVTYLAIGGGTVLLTITQLLASCS